MGLQVPANSQIQLLVHQGSGTAQPITLVGQILTKNGLLQPFQVNIAAADITVGFNNQATALSSLLQGGELLWAGVALGPGGTNQGYGIIWVRARLISAPYPTEFISDFLDNTHQPSYPAGGKSPLFYAGQGRIRTVTGADPAAGAEVADTVTASHRWNLLAVEVVLVTSGDAANRNVALFIDDAGATVTRRLLLTDSTNQTATQTRTHGWYPGTAAIDAASVSVTDTVTVLAKFPMTLPLRGLGPAYNIRTVTTNIQAADDYGAARYIVEEFIDVSG